MRSYLSIETTPARQALSHLIGLSSSLLAGLPSLILSRRTGAVLINSRMTSWIKEMGALVLIEPAEACDRDRLYPALSSAQLLAKQSHHLRDEPAMAVLTHTALSLDTGRERTR